VTRTFLDSGILLTGWKGREADRAQALRVMEDPEREFVSSQIVRLELMAKPAFFKNMRELAFYEAYFSDLHGEEKLSAGLGDDALRLGSRYGLAAADALNMAAAIRQGAAEFITTEIPGKSLFRVTELKVLSLFQA
jgi:hypothetical protein